MNYTQLTELMENSYSDVYFKSGEFAEFMQAALAAAFYNKPPAKKDNEKYLSIVRNIAAISKNQHKSIEWGLIIIGVVLGIMFNNRGVLGLLPVIGNLEYSIAIFKFIDNERALKISFAVLVIMFAVFNMYIMNFVGVAANAVVLSTTVINIVKGSNDDK